MMPRTRRKTAGTSALPKHTASPSPYLHRFLERLKPDADNFIPVREIHQEYVQSVRSWTRDTTQLKLADAPRRFYVNLAKAAAGAGLVSQNRNVKGYLAVLTRRSRDSRPPVQSSLPEPQVLFIHGSKGRGLFAACDYEKDQQVCVYQGQVITRDEYLRREPQYRGTPADQVIVEIPRSGGKFLDGNRTSAGMPLPREDNLGALVNHSRTSPNCRLRQRRDGTFAIFTITGVAEGTELSWDYGDFRTGVEPWMYS